MFKVNNIVYFEHISHLALVFSIVNFEHVNADWEMCPEEVLQIMLEGCFS